jgi:uncharacterized membrane protein YccF (DUF307 family)
MGGLFMSLLGNIIWLIFGGLIAALGYLIGGLALCLTIIGIPFGIASFQLAGAVLAPFGKEVRQTPTGSGILALIFNVLWILLFGWGIALAHIVSGIILCVTIIGIPFGIQHFKLILVALLPFTYKLE